MKATLLLAACLLVLAPGCPSPPELGTEITLELLPEAGLGGGTLTVAFVAYQDGLGAWQRMPGSNGKYLAIILNQRYGVAVGCEAHQPPLAPSSRNYLSIRHTTVAEATALRDLTCYTPPLQHETVSGAGERAPAPPSFAQLGQLGQLGQLDHRPDRGFSLEAPR